MTYEQLVREASLDELHILKSRLITYVSPLAVVPIAVRVDIDIIDAELDRRIQYVHDMRAALAQIEARDGQDVADAAFLARYEAEHYMDLGGEG